VHPTKRPRPGPITPSLFLRGVSYRSPMGALADAMLAGHAGLVLGGATATEPRQWRRVVQGTSLQWWSGGDREISYQIPCADITVDLHQHRAASQGRSWCIVDRTGVPLLHPFHALSACHREPYFASLHLIESKDGGGSWQLVAEAHLSSLTSYRSLLNALGQTSVRLLQTALRSFGALRRPWIPSPAASPRSHQLLRARLAGGVAWFKARVGGEVYGIAIVDRQPDSFLQSGTVSVSNWIQIPSAQGFIADPFFWPGRPGIILCETYTHRSGFGRLEALCVSSGRITAAEPVPLGIHCHLSYPFTWSEGGRVFCLPEMAGSRRQILYELSESGTPVPLCEIAENIGMADPTLMRANGRYWIAYADMDIGPFDNLCLMHADRPEGPWHAHPGNPVKIDVRSSRPGGTPFRVGGRLFRPAQDCSRTYGGALVINHVKTCTPQHYEEEPVTVLRPDPNGSFPDGLHTISFGNGCAVIDGKRNSYHPRILFHKLRRRLIGQFTSVLNRHAAAYADDFGSVRLVPPE
jgi:hypothetical protein